MEYIENLIKGISYKQFPDGHAVDNAFVFLSGLINFIFMTTKIIQFHEKPRNLGNHAITIKI